VEEAGNGIAALACILVCLCLRHCVEFSQLMQGAFENYARQAALMLRRQSVTVTSVEQTVVDRSKMRQSMLHSCLPFFL